MSTRISSLSIRTTGALDDVAVLEALDVRVLLGEQLLHRRRLGAELGGARAPRPRRSARPAARRRPRAARLGGRAVPPRRASATRLGGGCVARPRGGLGGCGSARRPRLGVEARLAPRRRRRPRRACRPGSARGGLGGGGLVGDGDRRDGLLGRLRRRRRRSPPAPARSRPAALRSSDRLSCRGFAPWNHERPERRSGRVGDDQVVRGDRWAAVRSFVLEWRWMTLFNCPAREGRVSLARGFARLQSPRRARAARSRRRRRGAPRRAGGPADRSGATAPAPLAVRGTPAELGGPRRAAGRGDRAARASSCWSTWTATGSSSTRCSPAGSSWPRPATKPPTKTAVVLGFGPRAGEPPADAAAWTRGAAWLPADDAAVEVRYRDPTQMGKVYLLPPASTGPSPGWATAS